MDLYVRVLAKRGFESSQFANLFAETVSPMPAGVVS
jgi:hypothetical protein